MSLPTHSSRKWPTAFCMDMLDAQNISFAWSLRTRSTVMVIATISLCFIAFLLRTLSQGFCLRSARRSRFRKDTRKFRKIFLSRAFSGRKGKNTEAQIPTIGRTFHFSATRILLPKTAGISIADRGGRCPQIMTVCETCEEVSCQKTVLIRRFLERPHQGSAVLIFKSRSKA